MIGKMILGDYERYRRMRPSWPAYWGRFMVGRVDGMSYVSDNIWILVNAVLSDDERRGREVERRDIDPGDFSYLTKPLCSLEGCCPAEYFFAGREWVVLRSEKRDILVDARSARWVERHCGQGQWYIGGPSEPARYTVDGQVTGVLMPRKADAFDARRDMGLGYDGVRFSEAG